MNYPEKIEFYIHIAYKLPIAFLKNPVPIYDDADIDRVKKIFEGENLLGIKESEVDYLYKSLACLYFSIKQVLNELENHVPFSPEDYLSNVDPVVREALESPAPLARRMKKIITEQESPTFKEDYLSDHRAQSAQAINRYLIENYPFHLNRKRIVSNILNQLFPGSRLTEDDIKGLIESGREISYEYLDGEKIKSKLIQSLYESDAIVESIKARFPSMKATAEDIRQDAVEKLLKMEVGRLQEIKGEAKKFPLQYVIVMAKNLILRLTEKSKENPTSPVDEGTLPNTTATDLSPEEIKRVMEEIQSRLTKDEWLMVSTYIDSKDYEDARRKLNDQFSRYKIQQAYEKAVKIAME